MQTIQSETKDSYIHNVSPASDKIVYTQKIVNFNSHTFGLFVARGIWVSKMLSSMGDIVDTVSPSIGGVGTCSPYCGHSACPILNLMCGHVHVCIRIIRINHKIIDSYSCTYYFCDSF